MGDLFKLPMNLVQSQSNPFFQGQRNGGGAGQSVDGQQQTSVQQRSMVAQRVNAPFEGFSGTNKRENDSLRGLTPPQTTTALPATQVVGPIAQVPSFGNLRPSGVSGELSPNMENGGYVPAPRPTNAPGNGAFYVKAGTVLNQYV